MNAKVTVHEVSLTNDGSVKRRVVVISNEEVNKTTILSSETEPALLYVEDQLLSELPQDERESKLTRMEYEGTLTFLTQYSDSDEIIETLLEAFGS